MSCYRSQQNLLRKATNLRDHFARYAARNLTRFQFRSIVTMLLVLTCVQTGVAQVELWTRQFGTRDSNIAYSAAVDRAGNIYVAGSTIGELIGQNSLGDGARSCGNMIRAATRFGPASSGCEHLTTLQTR